MSTEQPRINGGDKRGQVDADYWVTTRGSRSSQRSIHSDEHCSALARSPGARPATDDEIEEYRECTICTDGTPRSGGDKSHQKALQRAAAELNPQILEIDRPADGTAVIVSKMMLESNDTARYHESMACRNGPKEANVETLPVEAAESEGVKPCWRCYGAANDYEFLRPEADDA